MSETKNNNNHYIIIIILLIIIAILAFFIGQNSSNFKIFETKTKVTFLVDERCQDPLCTELEQTIDYIKALDFMKDAEIKKLDVNTSEGKKLFDLNPKALLPTIYFNKNNFGNSSEALELSKFLETVDSKNYNLNIGGKFDPNAELSDRGLLFLNDETFEKIIDGLNFSGDENSEILWLEHSDLGCGACQQFHNSGINETIKETFGNTVSKAMVGFVSVGGQQSLDAMVSMECMAVENKDLHIKAWDNFYKTKDYSKEKLEEFALNNGVNIEKYNECLKDSNILEKINKEKDNGINIFGITGTPGNILINKETKEYINAGWAIEDAVNRLLK
ncbi:MAG: DsbA family protein [Candidatus Gracilibacteria bacterium]|nr:DsbA family protein [Candidatus Gracilibacteria bacterium]